MLLGHNWVTNGSYLHKQISYKSDIGGSDYMAQESAQKRVIFESKWAFNDVYKKSVTFGNSSWETTQKTTQKILEIIKENPGITKKELVSAIGISENGIKYHINNLKKNGLLRRVGPDKGGYWEVLEVVG